MEDQSKQTRLNKFAEWVIKPNKGKPMTAEKKKKKTKVQIDVEPQNGKVNRTVVATFGEERYTDQLNPLRAAAREKFAQKVIEKFGIENASAKETISDLILTKAEEADAAAEEHAQHASQAIVEDRSALALKATPKEVVQKAEAFLKSAGLIEEIKSDFEAMGIVGETDLALTLYLIATSRKLDKPLSSTVKASSASGKSFVTEQITSLMPSEDIHQATNITPNALYYMPPG